MRNRDYTGGSCLPSLQLKYSQGWEKYKPGKYGDIIRPMQSSAQTSTANRQIARAAGTIMVTFVFAKVIGLLASVLLGRAFGASGELDAYYAANRVSDTLFNLVAGGALASAFIPTFTTLLVKDDRDGAWKLASAISNLVLLVLIALSLLVGIFAPWVVSTLLAKFKDPAQTALTVELLRIQIASAVIFGLSGLLMGILNAHQRFLTPALAPAMYPLGVIFGVEVLAPRMGIHGVAWGVVIGASLHLLVQLPQLIRLPGVRYMPSLGLQYPAVREVFLLMAPRLVGVAVVQLNFWVNTRIASALSAGYVSALNIAFALMIMPQAAIAQSIAIAALPTFSAQVARGKLEDMRRSLAATLRLILLLAIPSSVGLILLRTPLVALLYQGGSFTAQDTELVAWALLWYAAGLVGQCLVEITSRAFYALHDTRTPVTVGVIAMSLNVVFSLLFSAWFERIGLPGLGGLALANSLATALEAAALLALMYRRLDGLHANEILRAAGGAVAATAAMGAIVWLWLRYSPSQHSLALVTGALVLGGLVYAGGLAALRINEVERGWNMLAARLRR